MPAPIINDFHDDLTFFQFIKKNPEDYNLINNFKIKIEHIKKVHIVNIRKLTKKGDFHRWEKYCVIESDFQYYYTSYPYYFNKLKFMFKKQMRLEYKQKIFDGIEGHSRVYHTYDKGYNIYLRGFIVRKLKTKTEKSLVKTLDKIDLPGIKRKREYDVKRIRKIRLKEKRAKEKRLAELELVKIARLEKKERREKRKQEKIEREKNNLNNNENI